MTSNYVLEVCDGPRTLRRAALAQAAFRAGKRHRVLSPRQSGPVLTHDDIYARMAPGDVVTVILRFSTCGETAVRMAKPLQVGDTHG